MPHPQVVDVVERLRPIVREAGLTDPKINALIRNALNRKDLGAAYAASAAAANATVSQELVPQLARRMGVDEIERSGVAGEVSVRPTLRNRRVVCKVVVGPAATVGDVLAHRCIVKRLERHNGVAGKLRAAWDQLVQAVFGIGRANPYEVFTGAYEAFEEARKYEAIICDRMIELISLDGHGGAAEMAAVSRLENEILVMQGELSYWRGVLEDVKRTGDPRLARGLIEAKDIGKVTAEAVEAGYPELPSKRYYYRRRPNGRGFEGQEFQVMRVDASGPEVRLQVRRRGTSWRLEEAEGTGKAPREFEAALSDRQVLERVLADSTSLWVYVVVLTDPHGIALEKSSVHARMLEVIARMRARGATAEQVAAGARHVIDEDNLCLGLKAELHEEFFACAAREATAEAQMVRFRNITKHLNPGDRSSLVEDFLARREPGALRHVAVKQADHPLLGLTAKARLIDRVRRDCTAIEVKASKTKLSGKALDQLADYQKMAATEITVQVAGQPVMIKRVMYEFTDPAGALANLTTINQSMLQRRISVKIYNNSGHARILKDQADLVGIVEWLAQ
jgi:hypothetical protein